MINVGIIGGAGYTGGELLRLLVNHPLVNIVFVNSQSQAGKRVDTVHTDLIGECELVFTDEINNDIQVVFLCLGHGEAKLFLAKHNFSDEVKIIDLSQDHRAGESNFVYGLPELNGKAITKANYIANPGCFATCIQLALLPLANAHLLPQEIHAAGTTGSTGAGQALTTTSQFSWRQNNVSVYKALEHQHLKEINRSLKQLQEDYSGDLFFIPNRGSFTRGIYATIYLNCDAPLATLMQLYANYYEKEPFVFVSEKDIDLKQVVNTNKCLLHLQKHGNKLVITGCIDNLLKGASGQAVQNMNLLFGLAETTGLKLKASYF